MHKHYEAVKVKNWWQVRALTWDGNSVISRKVVATAYSQEIADEIENALEKAVFEKFRCKRHSIIDKLKNMFS